jgi:hypothetical protein
MQQLTTLLLLASLSPPLTKVLASKLQSPLFPQSHTDGYKFDPLLHLPGISPYFDAIGFGLDHAVPRDCVVTAASYLVRHAAIYANDHDYEEFIEPFLRKLETTVTRMGKEKEREGWKGSLALFDKWKSPYTDPENQLENITPQGIIDSKKVAAHLLSRYPSLVPTTQKIYADTKARTRDTAAAFVDVFPQAVHIVETTPNSSSFHSQNPHKACSAFSKSAGDVELAAFIAQYTVPILARLQLHAPVELASGDIVGQQQLCGYESAITGRISKLCAVFTDDEWMAYEYAWDLKYSHMVGHGNPLSPYLGFPWLNTTAQLFSKFHAPGHDLSSSSDPSIPHDDSGQRFFLSFTHREVPPVIATALGLFNSSNALADEFPTDRVNWARSWKMAELIPFLGHVGIEKLACDRGGGDGEFVRIIANSAPRPIPSCQGGPGASCAFDRFVGLVGEGMRV